ncbi:hypothetical protein ACJIZ3_025691 [Penstemon smallii]|uniref:Protein DETOXIFICATION n=1 Tax=Penstemon smallii TaxID=265156 RepID=A0ABD3TVQ3_9LAMI
MAGVIAKSQNEILKAMDNALQQRLLNSEAEQEVDLKGKVYEESKKIWRVALPGVISRVSSFGTVVVTQSFMGHISSVELAGYALVQTLGVRFINGILIGMSSATETLCGQAFGAKQYHMMGIFLQRSWLVDLASLTILLPIFFFATPIFRLLGEEEAIAKSAGYIALWFIPFCYCLVFSLTIQMYLQAQQKNIVIAYLSLMQFVIHIPLSYLFVYVLNYGVNGAMGALCISSWFVVLGEFIYIFGGWCPDSWKGFNVAAFKDIFPVIKLSISSAWSYGTMQSFVRVSNELGKGDAKAVKFAIKVLLSTSSIIGVICFTVCLVFGNKIGYVFSDDEAVAKTVADLSLLLAFSVLLNSIYPVFSGVAVGAGLQAAVAVINFVCFYLIGLPVGIVLAYVTHLQVKGLWIGMLMGVVTETLALSFMMWRTNWDEEVLKASTRLKKWYVKAPSEAGQERGIIFKSSVTHFFSFFYYPFNFYSCLCKPEKGRSYGLCSLHWNIKYLAMDNSIQETLLISSKTEQNGDLKGRIIEESKKIWRVAMPGIISRVSSFGTIVITQSFIGHISSLDLAGYALVQTLSVRFVNGILTLCGQAFGAKQHNMMGIYLQRSWFIDLITLTTLLPVFIFATPIFKLLGEEESIAKSAGYISLWFIPFIYGLVFSLTIQMYLQAQQKNMVIAWLSVFQFVIHILLSWLLVIVLKLGISGAMSALCVSTWFVVLGEFVYIFGGWCPETWKGFTTAAVKDLLPVVKLSISSGVMICLELWYYAILVLLAGYMKNAKPEYHRLDNHDDNWHHGVRVANELGRGDAKAVKFSIKVLMSTSVSIGLFFWILCLVFGSKIGYLFSSEEEVVQSVSDLSLLLAFTVLLGSIFPVLSGVAVGAGLQTKVAVINLVCFYVIGLPIGAVLGYVTNLQVKGIWIGMTSGVATQTLALSFMTWKTNWDEEVSITSARLKKWYLESSDENKTSDQVF